MDGPFFASLHNHDLDGGAAHNEDSKRKSKRLLLPLPSSGYC